MPCVLLYDMLYHSIRTRQTHLRFVGPTGDSFFGCDHQIMVEGGGDRAANATNGQLISECRQDWGYRSRCFLNDVDNVADKHKEQLQELIVVNVRASNVVGGWIVMTCLHEHHPFCPCAVV